MDKYINNLMIVFMYLSTYYDVRKTTAQISNKIDIHKTWLIIWGILHLWNNVMKKIRLERTLLEFFQERGSFLFREGIREW